MSRKEGQWRIRVLYYGQCPLCSREIRFLDYRESAIQQIFGCS
jgi:predicted DCC family thiol-disulfide oxidoreductase YuxK